MMPSAVSDLSSRLLHAVRAQDTYAVQDVIKTFRTNGVARPELGSALFAAIKTRDPNMVRLLIRNRAEVTCSDKSGMRPIHQAALSGSIEITKAILNGGSPVNVADNGGCTALHYAVEFGHSGVVALLCKEGANINRCRVHSTGETAMHYAAKFGRSLVVAHLAGRGADVSQPTLSGETPVHLAVRGVRHGVVEALCKLGAHLEASSHAGDTPLLVAVKNTSVELVRILLRYGAEPNAADGRHGLTPLHLIALHHPPTVSHEIITDLCLAHGAAVNQADHEGDAPLHLAARSGNMRVARLLVENGAVVNASSRHSGYTPFLEAVAHSRTDVVRMLLDAGADVNAMTKTHMTGLHLHVNLCSHNSEMLDILISNGAKLNMRNKDKQTPLNRCIFFSFVGGGRKFTLKRLIAAGATLRKEPSRSARGQHSPLCWLTWHGDIESAEFLVNAGWNLNGELAWIHLPGKNERIEGFLCWLREMARSPVPLRSVCRTVIREQLLLGSADTTILPAIQRLPLPTVIRQFVALTDEISTAADVGARAADD